MPTDPPGSTQGCNCQRTHCGKHLSQPEQHAGKNWTSRRNTPEKEEKHATDMNPIPQVHPACNSKEPQNFSGWPMALQSQAELGVSSNATWFPHNPDNYSWNHRWGNRGGARSTESLQPVTWAERTRLACLWLKKQNKTKTQTHNVANLSAAPLTTNIARTELLTRFKLHFPSLGEGLLGGWHFPRGMPFWQVSPSTHSPFSSTNWPSAWERPARRNDRQ